MPNGHWAVNGSGFFAFDALTKDAAGIRTIDRSTVFTKNGLGGTPQVLTNWRLGDPYGSNSITILDIATGESLGGFFDHAILALGVTEADDIVIHPISAAPFRTVAAGRKRMSNAASTPARSAAIGSPSFARAIRRRASPPA